MTAGALDVLMITYNRPAYTRLALSRLLETCDASCRVWLWQNGSDHATIDVVASYLRHPRVHHYFHSPVNRMLRDPTNWFLESTQGEFLAKVDDDCLMPDGWHQRLREVHAAVPKAGILGSWPFRGEDLRPDLIARKTVRSGGIAIMKNPWVGGSGYLMKRECVDQCGPLRPTEGFTSYCIRVAKSGWTNGWPIPFIEMDHMDDPRSEHTVFQDDAKVLAHRGITAEQRGIQTLAQLSARVKAAALELQTCSPHWHDYIGWRARARRAMRRFGR